MKTLALALLFSCFAPAAFAVDCSGGHNEFTCAKLKGCAWTPIRNTCKPTASDKRCANFATPQACNASKLERPSWGCTWDFATHKCH